METTDGVAVLGGTWDTLMLGVGDELLSGGGAERKCLTKLCALSLKQS